MIIVCIKSSEFTSCKSFKKCYEIWNFYEYKCRYKRRQLRGDAMSSMSWQMRWRWEVQKFFQMWESHSLTTDLSLFLLQFLNHWNTKVSTPHNFELCNFRRLSVIVIRGPCSIYVGYKSLFSFKFSQCSNVTVRGYVSMIERRVFLLHLTCSPETLL